MSRGAPLALNDLFWGDLIPKPSDRSLDSGSVPVSFLSQVVEFLPDDVWRPDILLIDVMNGGGQSFRL